MSRHLAAPLVFHSSRVSVIVVAVVGVVVGPVSYFGFFFFHPRVSDSVAWYGKRDGLRVTMSKRRGTAVYYWDPPLKFVLLSEHVCTPQGSFSFANNATLQTSQLSSAGRSSARLPSWRAPETLNENPLAFGLSLPVNSFIGNTIVGELVSERRRIVGDL